MSESTSQSGTDAEEAVADYRQQLNDETKQLMQTYRQQWGKLQDVQAKMRELSCSATAPRRVVSVTVGYGGVVSDITFPTSAYKRMAPAELAGVILSTMQEAQEQARSEMADLVSPGFPSRLDVKALMKGDVDLQSLLPETPRPTKEVRDIMGMKD